MLPNASELKPAAEALVGLVNEWCVEKGFRAEQFDLVGFSQGTALSYLLMLLYPGRVRKLAALSGFMPEGTDHMVNQQSLEGKPVFVSHCRQDEMVPVEKAREAVRRLSEVGAKVIYCETDGGHKVSKECMQALEIFLKAE